MPSAGKRKRGVPKRSHPSVNRKLTDQQVAEIRVDGRSSRQLAEVYGVDRSTISRVKSGTHYKST